MQQTIRIVTIRCPICDIEFQPLQTKTNICTNCLINQINVTENISAISDIEFCRHCRRYNRPSWVLIDRESKDLLTMCLKRIKGLEDKKIVEAKFIFTDPSTKLIKVQLTLQQEVMNGTSVQDSIVVDFHETFTQCHDCKQEFTPHTWAGCIQLRQRVEHKKTFFYLEQLIIKNKMNEHLQKVESVEEGMNLYFKNKGLALSMNEFIRQYLPVKIVASKEVQSFIKYTYIVDIPKICRDDLVILPNKLCSQMGGINQIQLCHKISGLIHLIDPITLRTTELCALQYFQHEQDIQSFNLKTHGTEFTVLDVQRKDHQGFNSSFLTNQTNTFLDKLCDVDIMRDDGIDYNQYTVKSHLGHSLRPGVTVVGYDLTNQNNSLDDIHKKPDIVLVRKKVDKEQKQLRKQKIKRLQIEDLREKNKKKKDNQAKDEEEFDELMNEMENDEDIKKVLNLIEEPIVNNLVENQNQDSTIVVNNKNE